MPKQSPPHLWPNPVQELLLKSIFAHGNEAINTWQDWQAQVDLTRLDFASSQMLPLLFRHLSAQTISNPLINSYKKFYQQNWAKNHKLFCQILPVLDAFHKADIETSVLKGAAISMLCYKDLGVRMMTDCDILIAQDQVAAAVDLLLQQDWQPFSSSLQNLQQRYFAVRHSHGFMHKTTRCKLDLHWRVFSECRPWEDFSFRENCIPLDFLGMTTQTLNMTDQLFHACIHGASENVGKKIQWVTDAMVIIRAAEASIDWQRLIALAKQYQLALPLLDTLRYLQERLQAPIAKWVLEELARIPAKSIIRHEYQYKTSPRAMSFYGAVLRSWHQHSRLTGFRNWGYRVITYPQYLRLIWGINSWWRLPVDGLRVILQRFVMTKNASKLHKL